MFTITEILSSNFSILREYDRTDKFPYNLGPNGIPVGSKSIGKLPAWSQHFQIENMLGYMNGIYIHIHIWMKTWIYEWNIYIYIWMDMNIRMNMNEK